MSGRATILGILLCVGLTLAAGACGTVPTPDPDNGVNPASYRQCISKGASNLASISSRLKAAKISSESRSAEWWDAQIQEVDVTKELFEDTLKGSTK